MSQAEQIELLKIMSKNTKEYAENLKELTERCNTLEDERDAAFEQGYKAGFREGRLAAYREEEASKRRLSRDHDYPSPRR